MGNRWRTTKSRRTRSPPAHSATERFRLHLNAAVSSPENAHHSPVLEISCAIYRTRRVRVDKLET